MAAHYARTPRHGVSCASALVRPSGSSSFTSAHPAKAAARIGFSGSDRVGRKGPVISIPAEFLYLTGTPLFKVRLIIRLSYMYSSRRERNGSKASDGR